MRWLFYRKFLIELNFVLSMSCLYVFGAKNGDERDKSTDIRMNVIFINFWSIKGALWCSVPGQEKSTQMDWHAQSSPK